MKRNYYIFSNGRLLRHQNTVYLHQYSDERADGDEQSLADAAAQNGCVLEDLMQEVDGSEQSADASRQEADASRQEVDAELQWADGSEQLADADNLTARPLPPADCILHSAFCPLHSADCTEPPRQVLQKRPIPVEDVESFYVFGEMDLNTKLLNFLARHKVPLHVFNYFGFYSGTFTPRQEINSGYLLVRQVEHYSQRAKRLALARSFIDGASFNIVKNLRYYGAASRGRDMTGVIAAVEAERTHIAGAPDIPTLMGIEGRIRAHYYNYNLPRKLDR